MEKETRYYNKERERAMKKKPVIVLKVGWEEALERLLVPHYKTCKCGCREMSKTLKYRLKELDRMIASGEAVVA